MISRRFYRVAGVTLQVESDLPMDGNTFSPIYRVFEVDGPGEDTVLIRYHFGLDQLEPIQLGELAGERRNLSIYKNENGWTYVNNGIDNESKPVRQVSFSDLSHSKIEIYLDREEVFKKGNMHMLSFYPNDMLVLSRLLVDRLGCMFHSSGIILDERGFLFVGHSGAGKSTMVKMLEGKAEILCDDRNIIRKEKEGFKIYGTWNHGEVPIVSPKSAPLNAIFFLQKADANRISQLADRATLVSNMIACIIKPLVTTDWWDRTLLFIGSLVREVPSYSIEFDLSGAIVEVLRAFEPEPK